MNNNSKIVTGILILILSVLILISMISFMFSWKEDLSAMAVIFNEEIEIKNITNKLGLVTSYFLIYKSFGIGGFSIIINFIVVGLTLSLNRGYDKLISRSLTLILSAVWLSVFSFQFFEDNIYSGLFGYSLGNIIVNFSGELGLISFLLFGFIVFSIIHLKITPSNFLDILHKTQLFIKKIIESKEKEISDEIVDINEEVVNNKFEFQNNTSNSEPTIKNHSKFEEETKTIHENKSEIEMKIEEVIKEETVNSGSISLVDYDHTLELKSYKAPQLKFLSDHDNNGVITINQEELEENKQRIIDTLNNYKIGIANIKATIGPTVTLYEIVPEAGIRISKIKNLEDDIALSLSALGIRIIAPMPGKGTIGIEVPNKNAKIVSMKSLISSKRFQDAEMELPLALGKTISNETFVVDLAKMPHLLMAGATGQGKSVGINSILTSLLFKKHPSEIKFILVDPKKVELTLFNKIERHYLAKLPDSKEPIITDNKEVIKTLNSLCIEMEQRYELLKNGMCRNIKEYNQKFKKRKLNPNDGHKFLPYLVLVVDEFADLIMTTGKEVETPIARLAQLARAVGIHLLIATQRPSVNVITGLIKANFPARIAFRVTSKIDSRTILDTGGADQLIGRGDMLFANGNDLVRLQCGFVDTPEIEKVTEIIGAQKGYDDAYLLPEFIDENINNNEINIEDRDPLFREAAELIVNAQQGSASLLQRKMKLGYNRAGRIIDQLEAAGIVGKFEGSKARTVIIKSIAELDDLLNLA